MFLYGQGSSTKFPNGNPISKHKRDPFCPREENEEILTPEVPSLSVIGALTYLKNTRPNITFSVNLLTRYNNALTKRHWNGIKHCIGMG